MLQEQSTISNLLVEMTPEQRDQYNDLETTAATLREEVEQSRSQIDHLSKEKDQFSKEISGSQVGTLYVKVNVAEPRTNVETNR